MDSCVVDAVVLHAQHSPMEGVDRPGPNQTYRYPRLVVEERTLDRLDDDDVRVEMLYAGICGTDVHLARSHPETGYILSSAPVHIPPEGRIMGHEGVGRVLAAGSNVRHVRPGQLVTFESIIVCHYCDVCRRGQFNQCLGARLLGLEKDGLFAKIVDVPAMLTHDVGHLGESEEGLRAAACVEPAGVAYVACRNTHVGPGDAMVVFGAGPIGLFCAMLGRSVFGASRVYVVEPVPYRRDFARRWCDRVFDVEEFFEDASIFADVVIEASGAVSNVRRVFRRITPNGRIALLARSGAPLELDAIDHMITNQISLVGSRGHLCGAFAAMINMSRHGRLRLEEVVTEVVEGVGELCRMLVNEDRVLNNCKVLVRM